MLISQVIQKARFDLGDTQAVKYSDIDLLDTVNTLATMFNDSLVMLKSDYVRTQLILEGSKTKEGKKKIEELDRPIDFYELPSNQWWYDLPVDFVNVNGIYKEDKYRTVRTADYNSDDNLLAGWLALREYDQYRFEGDGFIANVGKVLFSYYYKYPALQMNSLFPLPDWFVPNFNKFVILYMTDQVTKMDTTFMSKVQLEVSKLVARREHNNIRRRLAFQL